MRLPFIILVSTLITVGAVGVALAATHDTRGSGARPATTGSPVPLLPATTPPAAPAPVETMEEPADPAQPQRSPKDCPDDCADDCVCSPEPRSSPHRSQHPAKTVDDDQDGDGGDCGEAD